MASLSWEVEICYLQHKKWVMRTGRRVPPCRMETYKRAGALCVMAIPDPFAQKVSAGLGKSGFYTHFEGSQVKTESDSMELIRQSKSREDGLKMDVKWESTLLSALFCSLIQWSICFSFSLRFVIYCLQTLIANSTMKGMIRLRWWKSQGEICCCVTVFPYGIWLFLGGLRSYKFLASVY